MKKDEDFQLILKIVLSLVSILALIAIIIVLCCSCTLSFQNISTHGVASDLVDDQLRTDPKIDADVSLPLTGF